MRLHSPIRVLLGAGQRANDAFGVILCQNGPNTPMLWNNGRAAGGKVDFDLLAFHHTFLLGQDHFLPVMIIFWPFTSYTTSSPVASSSSTLLVTITLPPVA